MTTQRPATINVPGYTWPPILPGATVEDTVGMFNAPFTVFSPDMARSRSLVGVVDTGALHTIVPASVLEQLEVPIYTRRQYELADGSLVTMPLGSAQIELQGEIIPAPVLFGTNVRNILIGATTLETFGWAADPQNKRFIPANLTL